MGHAGESAITMLGPSSGGRPQLERPRARIRRDPRQAGSISL